MLKGVKDNPLRVVIISHFGRPEGLTNKYSWIHYLSQIQKYFDESIHFLNHGLTIKSLNELNLDELENLNNRIYLLENVRFHDEETNYKKYDSNNEAISVINSLGDVYVNDAFGCMHRDHLSISGLKIETKAFGYLVNKELEALKILMENHENKKILAIIGGAKMDDKLPLLESLSKKMNDIYIAGGNINSIIKNNMDDYLKKISLNKAHIHLMKDGLCGTSIDDENPIYIESNQLTEEKYFYDIGFESLMELKKLIEDNDIIFWNGTLGVVEKKMYYNGSRLLVNLLIKSGKKVIIGGGDTASFVNRFTHNFYFISTGGGATIDYISNGSLVGTDFFNK